MAYNTTYCRRIVDGNNKLVRQWKAQNGTILYEDPFYIPFYIHNLGSSACTITIRKGSTTSFNLYYSTNARSSWTTLSLNKNNTNFTFSIPAGRTCFIRGAAQDLGSTIMQFTSSTQNIDLGGNLRSLVLNTNFTNTSTVLYCNVLFASTFTQHVKNVVRLALPNIECSNLLFGGTFTQSPILYETTVIKCSSSSNGWPNLNSIVCTGHFQCYGNTTSTSMYVASSGTIYCPTGVTFSKNTTDNRFTSTYSARNSPAIMPKNWTYSQKSILNVTS